MRVFFIVALSMFLGACAKPQSLLESRQRTGAPQSATDVGVLLEGARESEVNGLLADHPEARVRVLNRAHGMYEIFGVQADKVKKEYRGPSSTNQFFEIRQPKKDLQTFTAQTPPAGFHLGALNPCVVGHGPTAVLTVEAPTTPLMGKSLDIGSTVRITGAKSSDGKGSPLKMAIAIHFPEKAIHTEQISDGQTVEFKTDTLGQHQVFLLVQNAQNECSLDSLRFVVTANRPYQGPPAKGLNLDLSKFSHLDRVSAAQGWKISEGQGIVIAIVDTGVDYNHPSLAGGILINAKEIPANGIDDEGNGFVDDVLGYDFVNQDAFPYDDDSHGTHVAGLAAGREFGLARQAQILPIKALNSIGGDAGTTAAAIRYAVDRGANIVNLSLGGQHAKPPPTMASAIDYAEQKGVLVVTAAGNGDAASGLGFDIDDVPVWPASLPNSNIIAVGASDRSSPLSYYSNFGAKSVSVVAPGGLLPSDPIYSAAFENPRGALFYGDYGTSMATPIVSGIAAQVWSQKPSRTFKEVKDILLRSGINVPELKDVTVSGKQVDSLSALTLGALPTVLF